MHAIALNTFNPKGLFFNLLNLKKKIRYQSAHYGSRNDKLRLRWNDVGEWSYALQLKTSSDYSDSGENYHVRYYLTKLWFDADMSGSQEQPAAGGVGSNGSGNRSDV